MIQNSFFTIFTTSQLRHPPKKNLLLVSELTTKIFE
ncbi:hypothetical protein Echvi_2732 [Echinicola vietnamensis DSM 17526]|uniref:Uncharacterized protein n=1 Tax=Echinicola vietnamensis (strain DSM 17526 / LMG 23754 / KMM 6221) TaxID=926556 RepID=L0G099_ECHVK|nr:hypothetical protein Echvi_2732 [Echinicola vietnamensis DSM 17526]